MLPFFIEGSQQLREGEMPGIQVSPNPQGLIQTGGANRGLAFQHLLLFVNEQQKCPIEPQTLFRRDSDQDPEKDLFEIHRAQQGGSNIIDQRQLEHRHADAVDPLPEGESTRGIVRLSLQSASIVQEIKTCLGFDSSTNQPVRKNMFSGSP